MTPAEVAGRIKAHHATQSARAEQRDALAWMIGQYAGFAYHDPKKYPRQPHFYKPEVREKAIRGMGDEEMKTVLTAYAETHNIIEEARK